MTDAEPGPIPSYDVRAARRADADFVVALIETVMRGHSERTWGRWDPDFHRAAFHDAFGKLEHGIIIHDGMQAGYLAIEHRDDAAYLQWLLLLPAFQKRGIGSAIVADLVATATAAGKAVQLRVLPVNEGAQRLYARLGFGVTAVAGDFIYMEHPAGARLRRR